MQDPASDVRTALSMIEGKTYLESAFEPDVQEQIEKTNDMVRTEDISHFPSAFQQLRNLGKEMWNSGKNAVRGLPVLATADVAFERITICQGCEFFNAGRCEKCGCFMNTKTQLASATCPLDKWK